MNDYNTRNAEFGNGEFEQSCAIAVFHPDNIILGMSLDSSRGQDNQMRVVLSAWERSFQLQPRFSFERNLTLSLALVRKKAHLASPRPLRMPQ